MNRILFLAIIAVLSFRSPIKAQLGDVQLKTGPSFDPKGVISSVIGQIDNTIYYTSFKRGSWLGAVRSNDLSQVFELELESPNYKGKKTTFRELVILGDKLIMISELYDKEDGRKYLIAQALGENGKNEGSPIELESVTAESKKTAGSFSWHVDSALGRMLLYTDMGMTKYSKEKFAFKVLDKNLSVVWSENLELPYPDKFFRISNYIIDKNDKLFMTCIFDEFAQTKAAEGKRKAKEEAKERGGNWYTYKILSFDSKTSKLVDYDVKLEKGQAIVSFDYSLDMDEDLNIVGLYANDAKSTGAHGVYFIKMNAKTGVIKTSNIKEFDKKMVEDYLVATLGEKRGSKSADKGNGIDNFVVDQIVNKNDGGLIISGEIFRSYTVCSTDPRTGATSCSTHYIYGYIITININPSGEVNWIQYVPKIQHTVNDGGFYSSYGFLVSDDKLFYIFNDNVKNYGPKKKPGKTYQMTSPKGSVTTIAVIGDDGQRQMEPNAKLQADKKLLRPKVGVFLATENKLILLAKWKNTECLVEVKIEK